jgi:uncharacterized protein (DUF1015 family)
MVRLFFVAIFRPFCALHPPPDKAALICTPPYDVVSTDEARQLAEGNPLSFLRVTRAEIEFDPGADPYSDAVYRRGADNLQKLLAAGHLLREAEPCFYLYRLVMDGRSQVGLVGVASCAEYDADIIKKHEKTRPDKEDDRARHIEILGAQTGPVFLFHRSTPKLDQLWEQAQRNPPEVDFTAPDGIRHSAWALRDHAMIARIEEAFRAVPALYIADGHHRSAAAARVARKRAAGPDAPANFFLAVTFPETQLRILGYNRLVKDLCGMTTEEFLARVAEIADPAPTPADCLPTRRGEFTLYCDRRWHCYHWREGVVSAAADPADQLDVAVLQARVLDPLLGIRDPRTDQRISFVGGIRGPGELVRRVDSGHWAVAFVLYPVSTGEIMAIADTGGLMPPKSTWFEPKLRDAMAIHRID